MEEADAQCLALPWGRLAVSGRVAHRLSAEEADFQDSGPQAIRPAQTGEGAADAAAILHSQNSERPAATRPQVGAGAADAAASPGRQILKPSGVSSGLCGDALSGMLA